MNVWDIHPGELTVRLLAAAALGGLIGLEREWNNHPAGFRTHIMVSLGSALVMVLSIYGFSEFAAEPNVRMDPARLAAQVVSGIGFLGAGAILRTGPFVSGLTTAASIWVVSGIGLAAGAGMYYAAFLATGLAFVSLFFLNKWEKLWKRGREEYEITVRIAAGAGGIGEIAEALPERGMIVRHMVVLPEEHGVSLRFVAMFDRPQTVRCFLDRLSEKDGVRSVDVRRGTKSNGEFSIPAAARSGVFRSRRG